ncbi:MAG: hypothetical protein BWK77_06960 [Verrucomicrobia bacterium A1]|nr:MAG: hypothetical protein BWK77_06960 [Verrucomicrobia bacterium A1]
MVLEWPATREDNMNGMRTWILAGVAVATASVAAPAAEAKGEPKGLPRCIEAQLKSGDAGAVYGFHGMRIAGAADRYFEKLGTPHAGDIRGVKKMEAAENPPGEWNTYEIDLDGGTLIVRVNGRKVNEATGCETLPGPIALQSEGGEIHFRKVVLDSK